MTFGGNRDELRGLKSCKRISTERQILHELICMQNLKFTLRSLENRVVIIRCWGRQAGRRGWGETGHGVKVKVR